jgi:hypothetical protein
MSGDDAGFKRALIAIILISNQQVIEEDVERVKDHRAKLRARREAEREQERER